MENSGNQEKGVFCQKTPKKSYIGHSGVQKESNDLFRGIKAIFVALKHLLRSGKGTCLKGMERANFQYVVEDFG